LPGGEPAKLGPTLKSGRLRSVMWKRRTHAGQAAQAAKVGNFVGYNGAQTYKAYTSMRYGLCWRREWDSNPR